MTKIVLNGEIILQRIQFYKIVCVFVSESLIFTFSESETSLFSGFWVCNGLQGHCTGVDVQLMYEKEEDIRLSMLVKLSRRKPRLSFPEP